MLISLNWIGDFVDLPDDLDAHDLAERFTRTTAEVDGVHPIGIGAEGLISARVQNVEELSGTRNLRLVALDIGAASSVETVTAAPMIHADNAASMVRAELSDPRWTIGLGVVQSGRMDSKVVFPDEGETEPGYVSSRFDPPYRLDPGKTLRTDPVWLSFGTRAPDRVLEYHSWAQSAVPGPEQGEALPRNWVTLDRDASADDLYRLAKQWRDPPGRHVLVPLSWRANAGELSGATSKYPKDMRVVARKLRKLGTVPGISIDPLAVQDGAREWTHTARNGVQWVDVNHPEAREAASARVRQIGEWGFDFFVVTPSEIPDSALRRFNVTRPEADLFALKIATDAAQGRPVLPSASFTLPVDGGTFGEAVGMIAVYENYGVVPGPVRLRVDGLNAIAPSLIETLGRYRGPVEVLGFPKQSVRAQLNALYAAPAVRAGAQSSLGAMAVSGR